jgi:hypothetical protein
MWSGVESTFVHRYAHEWSVMYVLDVGTYTSGVEPFLLCYSVFVPLHSVMWSGVERTYVRRYVREWSGTMPYRESFFQKKNLMADL